MGTPLLDSDDDSIVEGIFENDTALQGDIDAQLDGIISEFSGEEDFSGKIKVYQVVKGGGKMAWVFDCVPDELPIMERVRDEFGPGDYVSRFYLGSKLKRAFSFSIATPRLSQIPDNKSQGSGDVSALAEVIKQSFDGFKDLIVQNNAPQNQPSMVEMQTHFMTQMAAMKEMFGGGQNNSPIKDLKDMMSLVEDLRGEKQESEPKGILDVLSGLMDKAIPALTDAASVPDNRQRIPRKSNPTTSPVDKENNMNLAMKMKLTFLCQMAAKNADPFTYAGLIIDQSDENQLNQLIQFTENDNWIGELSKIHPDVANHSGWFGELKTELMGTLFSEPETEINGNVDNEENTTDTSDIKPIEKSAETNNDVHLSGGTAKPD